MVRLVLLLNCQLAAAFLHQRHHHRHEAHHRHHHRYEAEPIASIAGPAQAPADSPLKGEEGALRRERAKIADGVQDVAVGMNSGAGLHRLITSEKVKVAKVEQKINHLRRQSKTVREAHLAAARKLREVMLPRIYTSEQRLARKRAVVTKKMKEVQQWDQVRAVARNRTSHSEAEQSQVAQELKEAQREVQKALRKEQRVKQHMEMVENKVGRDSQDLRITETKVAASRTEVARELQEQQAMETSLNRVKAELETEQLHFDAELASREDKLEKHINKAELQKEKAERQFFMAKDEFLAWQADQKEKAREVATLRSDYEMRQRAFNAQRSNLMDKAEVKSLEKSASETDDEDWAWGA